jgi:hypothetical protein
MGGPETSTPKVRRVGSVHLGGVDYDLALNGEGILALEELDVYGRPAARRVHLGRVVGSAVSQQVTPNEDKWAGLAQDLLTLLARTMVERDAALASLHRNGGAEETS